MFGRKKKEEASEPPKLDNYQKQLEIVSKNIDLVKLTFEIEKFLSKTDDPFNYCTYTIHNFPENKLKVFKIEHGMKRPTTKLLIVIEGDSNNLRILDRLPTNYAAIAGAILISFPIFLPGIINARAYHAKLWEFIAKTVKSLEG